jgi:RNA polymerase sigma-70 factor (ECF subfamily)
MVNAAVVPRLIGPPMQRELVLRARGGDHDAFAALAEAASDHLTRTARLILQGDDEAADAVQEALVAAWLNIRAVREPDRFDAWLHRMVVHACYRVARRRKQRRVMEVDVALVDVAGRGDAQGPTVLRDQLERGFRRLTAEQRAVLVVHHYLGMSDREAAVVLDIPVGTFKSRLSRATAAIRASLEADERTPAMARESIA